MSTPASTHCALRSHQDAGLAVVEAPADRRQDALAVNGTEIGRQVCKSWSAADLQEARQIERVTLEVDDHKRLLLRAEVVGESLPG
jgi:hypothetical protein